MQDTKYLSNPEYSQFIALSRYARWLPDQMRRETWEETVRRYVNYWVEEGKLNQTTADQLFDSIHNMEVMPSMRALMVAGEAMRRSPVAAYNCAYLTIDRPEAFDETLFVLMNGTGVGFSCERQYVSKLPVVPSQFKVSDTTIKVEDSKEGWSYALRELVAMLYAGIEPRWDVSAVRPAGAPLKIFGGRASGPEPLVGLFKYAVKLFRAAAGRKLNSLEVHGFVCKIAEIVVVGGVRRAALISLSNLSDQRMRHAKSGQWWVEHPEYALSNNSIAYTEKPDGESFMREWLALVESKSGERGIFNRVAAQHQAAKNGRRDPAYDFGCNP